MRGDTAVPSSITGLFPVTYTYTDGNGCSDDTLANIQVFKTPSVSISAIPQKCLNGAVDTITEHSPKGGHFKSVLGISDTLLGIFNPSISGAGVHALTYYYTDTANGCSDSASRNVIVNDTLIVSLSDTSFCQNEGTILLNQPSSVYSGISGTYSGSSALVGNYYNPTGQLGDDTLTYSVTDTNNCTSKTTRIITVDSIPNIQITDTAICINAGEVPLNGLMSTRTGGMFWGNGIVNDTLNPVNMGLGLDTIYYSFTLGSNGCIDTVSNRTFINAAPVVQLNLPDSTQERCVDAIPATLSGHSPIGGYFYGQGVDSTARYFMADSAGVGTHNIYYTFTNNKGCSASDSDTVVVHALPVINLLLRDSICINEGLDTLVGGLPLGGIYSGSGVDSVGIFNPKVAGKGNKTIQYTYRDSATRCVNSAFDTIRVDSLTPITLGLIPNYCINEGIDTLDQGKFNQGSFSYSGRGVFNNRMYDPMLAGVGFDTITYSFTNLRGCSDSLSQVMRVFDTAAVNFNLPSSKKLLCENDSAFSLNFVSPAGGQFNSHPGIINGRFVPSRAGIGKKPIIYSFTNSNGCVTQAIDSIEVNAQPIVSMSSMTFCLNSGPTVLNTGVPAGGIYSGSGMVNDSVFNPGIAGVGTKLITYTYTNSTTGCSNFDDTTLVVNAIPSLSMSNLTPVCGNRAPFNLIAGSSNAAIKYYVGAGITDSSAGTFSPAVSGSGNHAISFVARNTAGCSDTLSKIQVVDSVPVVNLSALPNFCRGDAGISLTFGTPSTGGTGIYIGKGVNGSLYDPKLVSDSTDTLIYEFTNQKGCRASDTQVVRINPLPTITPATWPSYCVGEDSVTLSGALPAGGTYYATLFVDSNASKFAPDSVGTWPVIYAYTDANNCTNSHTHTVQVRDLPQVSLNFKNYFCENSPSVLLSGGSPLGSMSNYNGLGVSGNRYYPDSVGQAKDTLWYAYTDAFGCADSASQVISIYELPQIVSSGIPDVCENEANLNLNPFFQPQGGVFSGNQIVNGILFVQNVSAGPNTFTYRYTDSNNCSSSLRDTVFVREVPQLNVSPQQFICKGEEATLSASGGLSYFWNTGENTASIVVSPDSSSSYSVESFNQYNCSSKKTIEVTVHDGFSVYTSGENSSCGNADGKAFVGILRGKSPFSYFWPNGDRGANSTGLLSGTYVVTVTDANGCTEYATVDITDEGAPQVSIDSVSHNNCFGDENGFIRVSTSAAIVPIWSNGQKGNVLSGLSAGIYSVSLKDSLGCKSSRSVEIEEGDEIEIATTVLEPDCDSLNGEIEVKVKGGLPSYGFTWVGQTSTTNRLPNIGGGVYTLVVTDAIACTDSFDIVLDNNTTPQYRLDSLVSSKCGSSNGGIYLSGIDSIRTYKWNSGEGTPSVSNKNPGRYFVTLTDTNGCKAFDFFDIELKSPNAARICYVSYDSSSTFNRIVYDTTGLTGVDSIGVFKESFTRGKYDLLSKVGRGTSHSFIDSSLNTSVQVGKYKLMTYDACESSNFDSDQHEAMLLSSKKVSGEIIQLNWTAYQGINVQGYFIFRYSSANGFELIDSTNAGITTYSDFSYPRDQKNLYYFIMLRGLVNCPGGGTVVSNYSYDYGLGYHIGLEEHQGIGGFEIYPNPNAGEFSISFNANSEIPTLLRLIDTRGRTVYQHTLDKTNAFESYSIQNLEIQNGLYYLQVVRNGSVETATVVVNQ
jgi:hypothetical protein